MTAKQEAKYFLKEYGTVEKAKEKVIAVIELSEEACLEDEHKFYCEVLNELNK